MAPLKTLLVLAINCNNLSFYLYKFEERDILMAKIYSTTSESENSPTDATTDGANENQSITDSLATEATTDSLVTDPFPTESILDEQPSTESTVDDLQSIDSFLNDPSSTESYLDDSTTESNLGEYTTDTATDVPLDSTQKTVVLKKRRNYNGYRVYRLILPTEESIERVLSMEDEPGVQFWADPYLLLRPRGSFVTSAADLMVSPKSSARVEIMLREFRIPFTILVNDVQVSLFSSTKLRFIYMNVH